VLLVILPRAKVFSRARGFDGVASRKEEKGKLWGGGGKRRRQKDMRARALHFDLAYTLVLRGKKKKKKKKKKRRNDAVSRETEFFYT